MALITNSNQTLAAGVAGSWWTPTASIVSVDVDNSARVIVQTRRGSGDAVAKPVSTELLGPISAMMHVTVGRDYRFLAVDAATVAAQE